MSSLFSPIKLGEETLANRIVMSPMCQYMATEDGFATDWHLVHLASRAVGGVGLILVEATAVEPRGRISDNDLGLWSDNHIKPLERIVKVVHDLGGKIGIQLAHAGRKSESRAGTPVAPSPIPFNEDYRTPHELSEGEIQEIQERFAVAAQRALRAGFDVIEIHAAHGYLISEFLSPATNKRTDRYGGSTENRARFLRETIHAVRSVWPKGRPLFVRISASDYTLDCLTLEETLRLLGCLKNEAVDVWDISSGGIVSTGLQPVAIGAYPGYQIPYASRIKRELGLITMAVGLISSPELAEYTLQAGNADLIALGRELLRNPYWPLSAARALGEEISWPKPYERAK